MQIHTNNITSSDLYQTLPAAGLYVAFKQHGSRSRDHAFRFRLSYLGPKVKGDGRRARNTGTRGADNQLSATWDEHGEWFARLFDIDPNAVIGPYKGRDDFHKQTDNRYNAVLAAA